MKTIATALLLALCASTGFAQDDLVAQRDEKLKSEFLKKADWITDYDKARETAKSSGKVMFTLFSRSYAPCPACHQLENGPLLAEDFAKFAKDYVLYLHITTMIPGEKYGDLLEQKGGNAFPWMVFMDSTGEIILEHQGERSAAGFAKSGEQAKNWLTLKDKAEKGDAAAKVDFAILQLTMGRIPAADAEKIVKEAGAVTPEQKAKLDAELVNAEIREAVRKLRSDEEAAELGKKFYARHKEGKPAPTADSALQSYFILIMDAAEAAKDADTFASTLKIMKDKYGKMEQAAPFFEEKEKSLKALQTAPKK
jgi:hypothetical protein